METIGIPGKPLMRNPNPKNHLEVRYSSELLLHPEHRTPEAFRPLRRAAMEKCNTWHWHQLAPRNHERVLSRQGVVGVVQVRNILAIL